MFIGDAFGLAFTLGAGPVDGRRAGDLPVLPCLVGVVVEGLLTAGDDAARGDRLVRGDFGRAKSKSGA
jgi:hypothetical protein